MFTQKFYKNRDIAIKNNPKYMNKYFGNAPKNVLSEEKEIPKYYTFDERGHIMVVTTSKDSDNISPEVSKTFQKVIVFFAAWTAALSKKGKTLFDYDAVKSIITNSGFFIDTGMEKRSFHSESTSASLDTTIIQDVLGNGITGGGIAIAKRVLATIGNTINVSFDKKETEKEICHLLFICESLMGMPIVSISLFHTKLSQYSWVSKTNCSQVSRNAIDFKFDSDDFLFADPDYIDKFTKDFEGSPEFDQLIDKLAGYIK